jgi:replicative DNA helicase
MYAPKQNLVSVNFGGGQTLPPQNVDAEEAILGGILLDPNAIGRVVDILVPEAFYISQHREIYKAAVTLHAADRPTDLLCVSTWLYDHDLIEKIGGQSKLVSLVDRTVTALNIDRFAALVMDKYQRRKLIHAGNEIVQLGYETSVELDEVINQAEQKVFDLTQGDAVAPEIEQPIDILIRIYDQLSAVKPKGLPTQIYDLDKLIGGLKPKKLYIVAGRSGMGKTQLAVNLAAQALKSRQPVVFFSAEMDRDELMTRVLAWESGVDAKKIEECTLDSQEEFTCLTEAINRLSDAPLYLDDTTGSTLTPVRIRSAIRRATSMYGKPGLIVLDYLQLLGDEAGNTNRVTELDKLANACKAIAKEFDVPFVALAQINRAADSQANKRPVISQLRESGAIEQAADVILLLYRDEYYNTNTPDRGICEVIVGKQRSGATGTVKTIFQPETSRFLNIAQREF